MLSKLKKVTVATGLIMAIAVGNVTVEAMQFFGQAKPQLSKQQMQRSKENGQAGLESNSRDFDTKQDIPNDDQLQNIITKNLNDTFTITLPDDNTFEINNLRVIDRESILKNYKIKADKLLSKQEIINYFKDKVEYVGGPWFYSNPLSADVKGGIDACLNKLISSILYKNEENEANEDVQKFFDVFIRVAQSKNKILKFNINKYWKDNNPTAYEDISTIDFFYKGSIEQGLDIISDSEYQTVPQYHPSYEEGKIEYYNYNVQDDLSKGIFFCHELNHILEYWLQKDMSSEQLNTTNINNKLTENLGLKNIDITKSADEGRQEFWTEIGEFFNIAGFLPVEDNSKTTLYVNRLYSDFAFFSKLGLPTRLGHIQHICPGLSYVPSRIFNFSNSINFKLQSINIAPSQGINDFISSENKLYKQDTENQRFPDNNHLKLYFALLGINKTEYENKFELKKAERKMIMDNQDNEFVNQVVDFISKK